MAFDLRLIEAMVVLAEELHFGRAAARLNVSQPTLSQQIRRLEDQLDVALLARTTRSVSLTPAGVAFVAEGAPALLLARRAEQAARRASSGLALLRAAGSADTEELTRVLISAFSGAHPSIELRFLPATDDEALRSVLDGRADIALVWSMLTDLPGVSWIRVHEPEAGLAMAADDPLAQQQTVTVEDILGRELVLFPRAVAEAHYDLLVEQLGGVASRPIRHVPVTSSSVQEAQIRSVARAGGYAPVTREHFSRTNEPAAVFRPLVPPLEGPVCLVWREGANPQTLKFVTFAEETTRGS